jgi:crotonobetainyl-CoA hydratase
MNGEHAIYEKRGQVALVTLNRPAAMNAVTRAAHRELAAIFDEVEADQEVRVAVLTGAGEVAFSAGADLKEVAANIAAGDVGTSPETPPSGFGGLTARFDRAKPLIAAVNGYALGGGMEMVLACDIAIAAEHARFGLPEPRWGVFPAAGGVHRLPRQISLKPALGLLLTGRQIDAQEALRLGLVNDVVPAADLLPTALRWAAEIAGNNPLCLQLIKEAVHDGLREPSLEAAMAGDRARMQRLMASNAVETGTRAFSEGRPPEW